MRWQRWTLWALWALSFGIALLCTGLLLQGVMRDTRAGDPVLTIDFSSAPVRAEAWFRVWGQQTYDLLLSSVNHDPNLVGRPLGAEFEVEIAAPDGKPVWQQVFSAEATGHRVPSNYGDVRLATMDLDSSPLRSWTMRVKILAHDPMFKTTQTQLKLYKRQYDPGMGGLMNYVMIIPAALFLLVALALSLPLARGGSRAPLILTTVAAVGFLWLLVRP